MYCSLVDSRASHSVEPPRRRLPQLAARRSAVLRARLAACRAPCPAGKAPRVRPGPSAKRPRAAPVGRVSPGSPPQQQGRFRLDGRRCPASPRQPTQGSGPVLGPCTLPNPEAEAEAEAKSRRGPRLLRAKTSDPHINRVFTASGGGSTRGQSTAQRTAVTRPRLRRSQSSSMPRTRQAIRPAAPSLRLLGLDRMQPVARQRGSVQPVAACAVCSGIVHWWHSAATQDAWVQHSVLLMRHTCVAQRQMSRRAAGVAQRSAGDGFGCGADVGKGWTRSQCKGGHGIDSERAPAPQNKARFPQRLTVNGGMRPLAVNGSVNGPLTAGAGPLTIEIR